MVYWSNIITACINLITLLLGLFLLGTRIYLAAHDDMICFSLLSMPCLRLGTILVILSLLGLLGICCRSAFLMWAYLIGYFILILVVTIGLVLWIVVMSKGAVRLDVGKAHQLNDFTFWFHDQMMGLAEWSQLRKCLIHKNICHCRGRKDNFFFSMNLKEGCCIPPPVCSENFLTVHDCDAWKKETETMCYYCSTCAQGFISQLAVLWQKFLPAIVALLVILITVFVLGCRVFRQNKAAHYRRLYQNGRP